ncbi:MULTISPECIES: hypothetical protein [Bradyrhizobium]|uniref:DNA polymerase III subunit delta n=1 Tax=Bradyrhizobium diazoefficiens TaxID=1355477 RepID=A0A809XNV7_9BRAD|nr:hypothetical protein [Bradyrhizobium diazoefficiens]MBP1059979.1 hypothetical protein [Bradyrhizobium japonicum]AWO88409.2 hypothetical protein DI395_07400 [Bradyrhizobium diazoefficiens]BCE27581.1 hypothetical protein XF2B_13500 [Bradyrhizobium diazoefficiens]BCE71268.1 hypothetical protein XF8B_13790 [Bradyrhizobium diazoefficiens]BCF14660.1 hypothetical protein XF13B_13510 [Bradyrhizobium diazoefficiens]
MLDVEFLQDLPATLAQPVVYRYRSGLLRGPLKRALLAIAERDGNEVVTCTPVELPYLSAADGLFPSFVLCDWPAGRSKISELDAVLAALTDRDRPLAVLVPESHVLFKRPSWPDAGRKCLVVEEPIVSSETLDAILEYLARDVTVGIDGLLDQKAFRDYFERFIADGGCLDLPGLKQQFDRVLLLHVDPETGIFSDVGAMADRRASRNELLRPLRGLVGSNDPRMLSDLLHGLAARFPSGRSGRELADELGRLSQNLFVTMGAKASRGRSRGIERARETSGHLDQLKTNVSLWTAVLLAWTPRLSAIGSRDSATRPVADTSLVEVDQLGREFTRRMSQLDRGDPLSGLWSPVEQVIRLVALEGEEPETVQGVLARALARELGEERPGEPRWIGRLRLLLAEQAAMDDELRGGEGDGSVRRECQPSQDGPTFFEHVIGHQVAVDGLRRRLRQPESGTPIILCGPEGVGKRTLGRLYAKGLLCEVATGEPPCGKCESCREFERGSALDFIEFDASAAHAPDYVQGRLLSDIRYASFARHRPILIANPDKAPRVVDMCLKTLEARSDVTRFIFTVTNLQEMSPAGQSRSDIYRLSPLDRIDAGQLAKRFLAEDEAPSDERIVDLITGSAGGLPRRVYEACRTIHVTGSTTFDGVRSALKLDWAKVAISYCSALLSREKIDYDCLELPSGWTASAAVSRVLLMLTEIYRVYTTGRVQHPAFLHLRGDPVHELATLLKTRAEESGLSVQDLWSMLAQHWAGAEIVEPMGFLEAGLEARVMIAGEECPTI